MSLMSTASVRFLLRHRVQCLLALTGVALGVAIVVGIQLTQHSAKQAFAASISSVVGEAGFEVRAVSGALSEEHWAQVRNIAPGWAPRPIVSGRLLALVGQQRIALQIIGVDPVSLSGQGGDIGFDLRRLIVEPGAAVVNRNTAALLELASAQKILVSAPGRRTYLNIIDIVPATQQGRRVLADQFALVDIATAQELLAKAAQLTRIDLTPPRDEHPDATLVRLRETLGDQVVVRDKRDGGRGAEQMTRAFYTNLDALSMLALLVGAFMIYNTMAFLVMQRQSLYARLRALGVQRRAIMWQVVSEALILGTLGGIFGNVIGFGFAQLMLGPLSQTLSDHYLAATTARLVPNLSLIGLGMVLALLCALLASLPPAWQAATTAPAAADHSSANQAHAQTVLRLVALVALVLALIAIGLLYFSSHSLKAGFAALGSLLLASSLASPGLLQAMLRMLGRGSAQYLPVPERLALKSASRSLNRIGLAVAALMAATATSIGVGIMVASFRVSVTDWLDQLLRTDIYITQNADYGGKPLIDTALAERILSDPRIAEISKVRRNELLLDGQSIRLTAYDLPPAARSGFRFLQGEASYVWARWDNDDTVIVSEPFAWHHELKPGDKIKLPTAHGLRAFMVTGIYADYTSERGIVAISWQNYQRYWPHSEVHSLGVYPQHGVDTVSLKLDLEKLLADRDEFMVWANADIQRQSLAVFDRTFVITDIMTLFAAVIAALGVFNAMLALNLERGREYAILRASGFSRTQLRRHLYAQTAITTGFALLLAIPVGVMIASLLIEVINVRSFGWSMTYHWDFGALALPCLLALIGALAASVYPAELALRASPSAALRHE